MQVQNTAEGNHDVVVWMLQTFLCIINYVQWSNWAELPPLVWALQVCCKNGSVSVSELDNYTVYNA